MKNGRGNSRPGARRSNKKSAERFRESGVPEKVAVEALINEELTEDQIEFPSLEKGDAESAQQPGPIRLTEEDLRRINSNRGLVALLKSKHIKLETVIEALRYAEDLVQLQIELVKLQRWIQKTGQRLAIIFE